MLIIPNKFSIMKFNHVEGAVSLEHIKEIEIKGDSDEFMITYEHGLKNYVPICTIEYIKL